MIGGARLCGALSIIQLPQQGFFARDRLLLDLLRSSLVRVGHLAPILAGRERFVRDLARGRREQGPVHGRICGRGMRLEVDMRHLPERH